MYNVRWIFTTNLISFVLKKRKSYPSDGINQGEVALFNRSMVQYCKLNGFGSVNTRQRILRQRILISHYVQQSISISNIIWVYQSKYGKAL
jgi:hypothetical protein